MKYKYIPETTKEILIDKVMKIKTSFNYSDRAEQLWSMDEDDLKILLKEIQQWVHNNVNILVMTMI